MNAPPHRTGIVSLIISLNLTGSIVVAQEPSKQGGAPAPAQTGSNVSELVLEEGTTCDMVFGQDGMLYVISRAGGRYGKGTISKLNPDAFSRLQRGADKRNHASPEDFAEVYVIGQPGEVKGGRDKQIPFDFGPTRIIAGADGKLYLSAAEQYCGQFDPVSRTFQWVKFGPPDDAPMQPSDPNWVLARASGDCFAVTADGMIWCKEHGWGQKGKVFHTRGEGKDLGALPGTDDWNYAALGNDGYLYGATDDYLARTKPGATDTKVEVLHAFSGKDDHPFEAPTLVGDKLFGYCWIGDDGRNWHSGYIYRLTSDGKDYANIGKLDSSPGKPLMPDGMFLYGMRTQGLFKVWPDLDQWAVVMPTKEKKNVDALCIHNGVAYLLSHRYQAVDAIFRIALSDLMPAPIRNAAQLIVGTWHGTIGPVNTTATFNPDGTGVQKEQTPTGPSGKDGRPQFAAESYRFQWSIDGNLLIRTKIQKSNNLVLDQTWYDVLTDISDSQLKGVREGRAYQYDRIGQPPRVTAGTAAGTSPAAPAAGAEGADSSGSNPAGPAADGTSVFHKRQGAGSGGTTSSTGSTGTGGSAKTSSFNSAPANQATQPPPSASYNPRASFGSSGSGTGRSKNTQVTSSRPNDSGPLSGDSGADAAEPGAGATPPWQRGSFGRGTADTTGKSDSGPTPPWQRGSFGRGGTAADNSAGTYDSSSGEGPDGSGIAQTIVQAYTSGDLATFSSLYADTVNYRKKRTSNADIQRQLSEYFAKWPVRQWSLAGPVKVTQVGPSAQKVVFSAQYDLSDPDTNRHASGIAKETLIVKDDGTGAMKITSDQEEITGTGDDSNVKSRKKGNRGQRIYDGRRYIPLPPGIPWPRRP
jgi:hypothetical protein